MNRTVSKKTSLIFSFILIIVLISLSFFKIPKPEVSIPTVRIGTTNVSVVLAKTQDEQAQGLSGTQELPHNTGMLFVFEKPAIYSFWMKDMNYPIDIIWIGDDKKVVHSVSNATPESYPNIFTPEVKAQYVLEVPTGFIKENHVSMGDKAELLITNY